MPAQLSALSHHSHKALPGLGTLSLPLPPGHARGMRARWESPVASCRYPVRPPRCYAVVVMRILPSPDPEATGGTPEGSPAARAVAGEPAPTPVPIRHGPDPRLAALETQLAEAQSTIATTAAAVRARETRIAELEDELRQRKARLDAIEAEARAPRRPAKSALERFMDGEEV